MTLVPFRGLFLRLCCSGLGPKDCDFTVAIQNNVEGFDKDKLLKKVKEHKEWEPTKTLCASTSAELLEALVGSL